MLPRRNRPSAFEVSFPDEPVAASSSAPSSSRSARSSTTRVADSSRRSSSTTTAVASTSSRNGKRRSSNDGRKGSSDADGKRPRVDNKPSSVLKTRTLSTKLYYTSNRRDIRETSHTIIEGEDPEDNEDAEDKPVRILSDFSVFDPRHDLELVPLNLLDEDDSFSGRTFEAAGLVSPVFMDEEDVGQEDEEELQRLRTSTIFRYTLDYTTADDPVYLETEYAWYMLGYPTHAYQRLFNDFMRPHLVAQLVISAAKNDPRRSYQDFEHEALGSSLGLEGAVLTADILASSIPVLRSALEDLENGGALASSRIIEHMLLGRRSITTPNPVRRPDRFSRRQPHRTPFHRMTGGSIDLAVLRREKQNPTHVTPLIDELATGLFNEHLVVVGPPPNVPNTSNFKHNARLFLFRLLEKTQTLERKRRINFPVLDRIPGHHEYWNRVEVDGESYSVGEVVLFPAGKYKNRGVFEIPDDLTTLPETASVADFFWFAKITYINQPQRLFHIQWLEHSSRTILDQISDPQELFMCPTCDDIDIKLVVDKVDICEAPLGARSYDVEKFHYSFMYNEVDMSFSDIQGDGPDLTSFAPPENCLPCVMRVQRDRDEHPQQFGNTVSFGGRSYHHGDFVLIQRVKLPDEEEDMGNGAASVGQILDLRPTDRSDSVIATVKLLGRVSDIISQCPSNVLKDQHHLFMTDVTRDIAVEDILQPCMILHQDSIPDLSTWLGQSALHFYVKYHFPSLHPAAWSERQTLSHQDVSVCDVCFEEETAKASGLQQYLKTTRSKPLRAFDPFGGVGAFGFGLESSGCIKMTHAVEISPSAAHTLKTNSPETVVYNQCSNIVLRYAVKKHENHDVDPPRSLDDDRILPPPPRPGEFECIVAGFPCQPHSRLNMFQRADDRKSHLILNLLAWVDFLKPKFCFFENVRGFLSYNLNATQAGRYRTEGGIKMGGLKFLVRALLAMGYQVRFGLLQAAHYGAPQKRVRFFLVAARHESPLPALPQPTHDFSAMDALEIKFPNGEPRAPIRTTRGIAPFPFVSVKDAIGDLPCFDWKNPRKLARKASRPAVAEQPRRGPDGRPVPVLACEPGTAFCGFAGAAVAYASAPRTSFQAACRARPTKDLQHFTRVLKPETVERVVNIPLEPKADYRRLEPYLWEWQIADPSSANARDGYRPGFYGRLDACLWFNTTVTNVEPTAKQSWVLHPWCRRVLSVRELARSQGFPDDFVFFAANGDVKTMQRQIGNAVPWPVAAALGRALRDALLGKWLKDRAEAELID